MRLSPPVVAVLALAAAACGPVQGETDPAADIIVTVGRAYADRAGARLPVEIENRTGATQPYVQVTCAFYDDAGVLIESAIENWRNVPAGGRVSGEVLPDTMSAARVDCVPSL